MLPEHPTLDEHGWTLDNAEDRHAEAPDTFHIPSRDERESLTVGRRVQLLFLFVDDDRPSEFVNCEKMWVSINAVQNGRYTAILDNLPAISDRVAPGDTVAFGLENIGSILIPKTDPRHPDYSPPQPGG